MEFELLRKPAKPGEVVIRFGDWRKGEPTVLLDQQRWLNLGKPETVTVHVDPFKELRDES